MIKKHPTVYAIFYRIKLLKTTRNFHHFMYIRVYNIPSTTYSYHNIHFKAACKTKLTLYNVHINKKSEGKMEKNSIM